MRNKIINLKTYLNRLVRGNERGVALIFTLGILGLLMVIALAFASTSMVERKVAANVNNNQVAKLLAKSALERIEAGLNAHGTVDPSYLMSHDTNAGTRSFDWLWKMETSDSDVTYTLPSGAPADSAYPTWQYVLAYKNSTDSEIIGRFAYAVIPNNGKLDPTAVADSDVASIQRPGVSVTEIDIANIDAAFAGKDQVWGQTLINDLGSNGRWSDLSQLAKAVSADISKVSSYFQIRTTPDPESFWFDIDKDDKVDTGEAFHRFNMVRTDWNTVTVDTICPAAATADSEIAKQYTKTLAAPNDTGGIPWFKNWSSSLDAAGTFGSVADKKNQIVANFIQYSSPETRAVISDVTPSNWLTSEPAYTGLKRTPYINEIGADVTLDATVNQTGGDIALGTANFDVIFKATVRLGGELIYMYGASVPSDYQNMYLYISGDVYITPKVNATTYGESSAVAVNASDKALKFSFSAGSVYSDSDFTPSDFTVPVSGASNGSNAGNIITVTTINLTNQSAVPTAAASGRLVIKRAVLGYVNGAAVDFVDYAKINKTANFGLNNTPYSYSFACQVADPRQNLNSGDWTASAVNANSAYPASYPGTKTAGSRCNSTANPSSGSDAETTSDPAYVNTGASQHVSTAYIRHAAMKSPWEIGAIHRGAAWQTLNLNKSASRSAANALIGGGAYADGDANLLDQVKFTSDTELYGKVNINTSIDEVLNALFAKLPYRGGDVSTSESKYENPGTGSSYSQVSSGPSFETLRGTTVYKKRTEFINGVFNAFMTELYKDTSSAALDHVTDAQKEQLVGKFINLTKAEPLMKDELAVVILTQSIKEAQPGVVIYKDWNNSGSLVDLPTSYNASYKIGHFNSGYLRHGESALFETAPTVPYKITSVAKTYQNGADQITGECKMIVVYARDTVTGKWKMKRVRYVE